MRLSLRGVGDPLVTTDPLEFLAPVIDTPLTPSCMPLNASGPLQIGQSYCAAPTTGAMAPACMPVNNSGPLAPGQTYCGGAIPGYTCVTDVTGNCIGPMSQVSAPGFSLSSLFSGLSTNTLYVIGGLGLLLLLMSGGRRR